MPDTAGVLVFGIDFQAPRRDNAAMKKNTHGGRRPGAGRKPTHDESMVQVAMRVPRELLAKVDAYAKAHGLTRNETNRMIWGNWAKRQK